MTPRLGEASPRPRVVVSRPLPGQADRLLRAWAEVAYASQVDEAPSPEALWQAVQTAHGLVVTLTEKVDAALLVAAPFLRAVATVSAGTDHLDVQALAARGIASAHVPDTLTETTADLVWALCLAAARRLGEGERLVRQGGWGAWSPFFLLGKDVYGQTLGVVGLGRIGRAVARRARGFGMRVLYHNRHRLPPQEEEELGVAYRSLEDLLRESDFVVLLVPGGQENKGLIGPRELSWMKADAVLVNAGRGDALDIHALEGVLAAGKLAGVGLDVYAHEPLPPHHPILRFERVVALPHIGSATLATRQRMAEVAAEALRALWEGRPLPPGARRLT